MITISIPGTPLAMFIVLAIVFLAAMGAVQLCQAIVIGSRTYFEPEPQPLFDLPYETRPAVQLVEVHAPQREEPQETLRPAPVAHGEAPIFDRIALPLPPWVDFGLDFWAPRWTLPTGAYRVVEESVEEPSPSARERFATPTPERELAGARHQLAKRARKARSEQMAVAS